jgi:hypothetical protein
MNVFISWDGDHIGRQVGRASLHDDVEGLRRISQQIDHGNVIWKSWIESHGGSLVSMGGDEGRAEVPAAYLDELDKIRKQYQEAVGSTVSVGVGMKLSESDRALLAAKLRGGDRIEFYTDEVNEIVTEAEKRGQQTEENKIADEYLNKTELLIKTLKFKAAFRHPSGEVYDTGNCHRLDLLPSGWEENPGLVHGFIDEQGKFYDRKQALEALKRPDLRHLDSTDLEGGSVGAVGEPRFRGLSKIAMNPGAFAGVSAPSQATVDKPTPIQGEHSEAQVAADEQENSGQSPELTHAGDDFEQQFHDAARSQEQEDTQGHAQATKNIDDVKKKIVVALQMLKQQAPVMEQIKQTAPDAYQAMVGLAQAVIGLSREIQAASPVKKYEEEVEEILRKTERRNPRDMMVDAVRGALGAQVGHDCMGGDCYAGAEALYHLLGGNEAGWNPSVVNHQNVPHWYLKNRHSGTIIDPTANQREAPAPYDMGKAKSFVTALPSKRAGQVISKVLTQKREADAGEPMQKMAIADIPAGNKIPKASFDAPESYDYTHVLPENHRANGYSLSVERPKDDRGLIAAVLRHKSQKSHVGYLGARLDTRPGHIDVKNSHINEQHRGIGLGIPMYEALYAHAKHKMGITHAMGGEHSTSAGAVHQKLAAKHGMVYKPKKDFANEMPSSALNKPFDGRYEGYRYALKNELKAEKDPDDKYDAVEDGDLEKGGLPMPGASAHHHVVLPVGSTKDQKVKVQHPETGKAGWVSVQAGQVMSQDGHAISSRNPGGK